MKTNNFFFSKFNLSKIFIAKYLSHNVYSKFLIHKFFLKPFKKVILIDNFTSQFFLISRILNPLYEKKILKPGCTLSCNVFLYSHSKLYFLYFKGVGLKVNSNNLISIFYNRLKYLSVIKDSFFLYKIVRGGCFGFSKGIFGYISYSNLCLAKAKFLACTNYIIIYSAMGGNFLKSHFSTLNLVNGGYCHNFSRSSSKRRLLVLGQFKYIFTCYSVFSTFLVRYIKLFKAYKTMEYYLVLKYIFLKYLKYFI